MVFLTGNLNKLFEIYLLLSWLRDLKSFRPSLQWNYSLMLYLENAYWTKLQKLAADNKSVAQLSSRWFNRLNANYVFSWPAQSYVSLYFTNWSSSTSCPWPFSRDPQKNFNRKSVIFAGITSIVLSILNRFPDLL